MKPLTLSQYNSEVRDFLGTVILFFHATWDTPGLATGKFLRVAATLPQDQTPIKFFIVDYDTERELVQKFSVRELPIVFCLKNGQVTGQTYTCETVQELINLRNM